MKHMRITVEFTFEAAHILMAKDSTQPTSKDRTIYGACSNIHGHTYILQVTVCSLLRTVPSSGMIINFKDLKSIVKDLVINQMDHTCLNEIPWMRKPVTAENMIDSIYAQLKCPLEGADVSIVNLRLYEGGKRSAWVDLICS